VGGIHNDCLISTERIAVLKPEDKYTEGITHVSNGKIEPGYAGNCPFLRHNREKYLEVKKEKTDALREKEKTEGEVGG
jgi:hypothetical protein